MNVQAWYAFPRRTEPCGNWGSFRSLLGLYPIISLDFDAVSMYASTCAPIRLFVCADIPYPLFFVPFPHLPQSPSPRVSLACDLQCPVWLCSFMLGLGWVDVGALFALGSEMGSAWSRTGLSRSCSTTIACSHPQHHYRLCVNPSYCQWHHKCNS